MDTLVYTQSRHSPIHYFGESFLSILRAAVSLLTYLQGTLTSLAVYTFMENFKATSPYADMVPPISEFSRHPFQYIGVLIDILKLNVERESAITAEKRRQRVEDVAKRNEYRKAHGLEPATGFLWAKADDSGNKLESVEAQPTVEPTPVPAVQPAEQQPEASPAAEFTPEGKRKKFLGIF